MGSPMTRRGAYKPNERPRKPQTLGERIRACRLALGWTQRELAGMLFVPPQAVGGWERNETKPIVPLQVRLSEVFGLSQASLVGGHGFKTPGPDAQSQGPTSAPVMAMVGSSKKPLLLPPSGTGEIWSVVIGENEQKPVNVAEAAKALREAVKQGARAWVVVEPLAPEKAAKTRSKSPKPSPKVQPKSRK